MVKIKLNNSQGNDAVQAAKNARAEKAGSKPVESKADKVSLGGDKIELSHKGAKVSQMVDQIKQMPDVRQDRVDELKQKIASGEYGPSSDKIAAAILKDEK
jgi:negative regulator of flagellin synthesis FlgM